ncbi:MAG: hypothetical protein OSJ76_07850 [Alphaproteobacteria bacterium]|nr:hypothetical protein [Alphaproteobacteria bacterium]
MMNTPVAMENTQGFMYQGHFSETLDITPLREKISRHLSLIRSVKNNEDNSEKSSVELGLESKERSK